MKIVDDKGRLFGKINIIDFFFVCLILALTPMFYYGWKLYNRPQSPKTTVAIQISEYEELKIKSLHGELLIKELSGKNEVLLKENDALIKERDNLLLKFQELKEKQSLLEAQRGVLQSKISNFLKEHKHAIKYF